MGSQAQSFKCFLYFPTIAQMQSLLYMWHFLEAMFHRPTALGGLPAWNWCGQSPPRLEEKEQRTDPNRTSSYPYPLTSRGNT